MAQNNEEKLSELNEYFGSWFDDKASCEKCKMTKKLYPYSSMFSPITVNKMKIKNRLVMAPMGNISMADETGRPSKKMIEYFAERAKGGVGLITSGLVPVSQGIDPTVTELGDLSYFPRFDRSRSVFAGWRDIAEKCHAYGAKFFIQLTPGMGRVGSPECLIKKHKLPVSASLNPNFYMPDVPCRPLTDGECKKIIKRIGQASADAKAALIDGVYLHGHEGYLLEQMTNPAFNRRLFGKYKNCEAFGIDIIKEIRRRVGNDYPIMYRIDMSLMLNATYGDRMKNIKSLKHFTKERTVDMTLAYMKNLVKAGVDMFDVDLGCYDNWWLPHPPSGMPAGCYLDIAKIAKDYFRENNVISNAGMEVPVSAVGRLGYPDIAEKALRDSMCDMVMLGRPLLADSDWPNKAYAGKVEDIRPCIGDQEGCMNEFVEGGHPQCTVNPRTGYEDIYNGSELSKVAKAKKIAVVGGGPAGILSSVLLSERGHNVSLFEKNKKLGGMLIPGSKPKMKIDVENYLNYLLNLTDKCKKNNKLSVNLGKDVSASMLKKGGYDVIITACGTVQKTPPIKGIDKPHVYSALDILRDSKCLEGKKNIVVIGGGSVGCETAMYIKKELKKDVTIVEMMNEFMHGVCTANRTYLLYYLEKHGVALLNSARVKEIKTNEVIIEKNMSPTVPNPAVTWAPILPENIENPLAPKIKISMGEVYIGADAVVVSIGGVSDDSLYYELVKTNAAPLIKNIGDSHAVGKIHEATKAAYQTAISVN